MLQTSIQYQFIGNSTAPQFIGITKNEVKKNTSSFFSIVCALELQGIIYESALDTQLLLWNNYGKCLSLKEMKIYCSCVIKLLTLTKFVTWRTKTNQRSWKNESTDSAPDTKSTEQSDKTLSAVDILGKERKRYRWKTDSVFKRRLRGNRGPN